jgi:hypothetical protein
LPSPMVGTVIIVAGLSSEPLRNFLLDRFCFRGALYRRGLSVSVNEGRSLQVRRAEVRRGEVGSAEVHLNEVLPTGFRNLVRILLPPPVPRLNSALQYLDMLRIRHCGVSRSDPERPTSCIGLGVASGAVGGWTIVGKATRFLLSGRVDYRSVPVVLSRQSRDDFRRERVSGQNHLW